MKQRLPWLFLFVMVNVLAAILIWEQGRLLGSYSFLSLQSDETLLFATLLTVVSYVFFLLFFFSFFEKKRFRKIYFPRNVSKAILENRVGICILVLQFISMMIFFSNGMVTAGSHTEVHASFLVSIFSVSLPVDALFLIYYGFYRESKLFYLNGLVWIVSNFIKGWSGFLLTLIFLESCRFLRKRKRISYRGMMAFFLVGVLVLLLYPVLLNMKWVIRASDVGVSTSKIVDAGMKVVSNSDNYSLYFEIASNQLIGRMESVSQLMDTMRLSDMLQRKFDAGGFVPFWLEGLHGIAYERLVYGHKPRYIGAAFTEYETFPFHYMVGDWNVSLGYPSWFFITPYLSPIYLIYTFFLGWFSMFLMKNIGRSKLSMDVLWYSWFGYLLAPWFAVFITFLYAMVVFFVIQSCLSAIPKLSFIGGRYKYANVKISADM